MKKISCNIREKIPSFLKKKLNMGSYICYGISTYRKEIAFQKISLTDLYFLLLISGKKLSGLKPESFFLMFTKEKVGC